MISSLIVSYDSIFFKEFPVKKGLLLKSRCSNSTNNREIKRYLRHLEMAKFLDTSVESLKTILPVNFYFVDRKIQIITCDNDNPD